MHSKSIICFLKGHFRASIFFIVMGGISLGVKKLSLQLVGNREEIIDQVVEIIFENLISMLENKL